MRALSCTFPAVTIEMQGAREPSLPLKVAVVLSMDSIGPVSLVPTKSGSVCCRGRGRKKLFWTDRGLLAPRGRTGAFCRRAPSLYSAACSSSPSELDNARHYPNWRAELEISSTPWPPFEMKPIRLRSLILSDMELYGTLKPHIRPREAAV